VEGSGCGLLQDISPDSAEKSELNFAEFNQQIVKVIHIKPANDFC
jgi:hypothetical protein